MLVGIYECTLLVANTLVLLVMLRVLLILAIYIILYVVCLHLEYYKDRLCAVFQKLISIPAAYQKLANPCPRVKVPDWLARLQRARSCKNPCNEYVFYM